MRTTRSRATTCAVSLRYPKRTAALATFALLCLSSYDAYALNPDSNENVLVFDAGGFIQKSYHVGDFTTLIDATDIHYQDFDPGSPPTVGSTGTEGYSISAGEHWVPNSLPGTFPTPPALGLPAVSLYSFGDAVLDLANPSIPGVAISPKPGTYSQAISVELKALPPPAQVELFEEGSMSFQNIGSEKTLFVVQDTVFQVRAILGVNTSVVQTVTYTISQEPTSDTDEDTLPDLIEVEIGENPSGEPRFNPLIADRDLDSDNDGLPDIDELLRGSDPDNADNDGDGWSTEDEINLGSDPFDGTDSPAGAPPAYSPPLLPPDTDGDSWFDLDEMWRGTDSNDDTSFPTARWLYEVETLADGTIAAITDTLCTGCMADLTVDQLDGVELVHGIPVAVTPTVPVEYGFANVRSPRGNPSLVRFAEEEAAPDMQGVDEVSVFRSARRYLPAIQDPTPADLDPADWYSGPKGPSTHVTNWLAAWEILLMDTLYQAAPDVVVSVSETAPVAALDRALGHLAALPSDTFYVAGRPGFAPAPGNLTHLQSRLMHPVQVPPSLPESEEVRDTNEYLQTLASLGIVTPVEETVQAVYAAFAAGDDVEANIAPLLEDLDNSYPLVLALSLSYQDMLNSGYELCQLLNPYEDLDSDDLANYVEAMGLNRGRETSIFSADTDGDGMADAVDNCPTSPNTSNTDSDSDGLGDFCDPDDDNDGIPDALEDQWMYNTLAQDSDGDGWPDAAEWEMGLNSLNPNDAIFYHTRFDTTNVFTPTSYPNAQTVTPLVFASVSSYDTAIPSIADLRNISLTGFESRIDKDPGIATPAPGETVSYLVFSPNPIGWNSGGTVVGADWENVTFNVPFVKGETPLVLLSIQTEGDSLTFYPEIRSVTHAGFDIRIRPNAFHTPPASIVERVAWAAFRPSNLPVEGQAGDLLVGASVETVLFEEPFEGIPDLFVSLEGTDANAIVGSVGPTGFQVLLTNDLVAGGTPASHRLSWLALGDKECQDPDMDGVCSDVDNSPTVYNPDQEDTDGDGVGNVEDVDADNDGLADYFEAGFTMCGLAPFDPDSDDDGIPDGEEDDDMDGFTTTEEFLGGSDPFNSSSTPVYNAITLLALLDAKGYNPDFIFEFAENWMSTSGP